MSSCQLFLFGLGGKVTSTRSAGRFSNKYCVAGGLRLKSFNGGSFAEGSFATTSQYALSSAVSLWLRHSVCAVATPAQNEKQKIRNLKVSLKKGRPILALHNLNIGIYQTQHGIFPSFKGAYVTIRSSKFTDSFYRIIVSKSQNVRYIRWKKKK